MPEMVRVVLREGNTEAVLLVAGTAGAIATLEVTNTFGTRSQSVNLTGPLAKFAKATLRGLSQKTRRGRVKEDPHVNYPRGVKVRVGGATQTLGTRDLWGAWIIAAFRDLCSPVATSPSSSPSLVEGAPGTGCPCRAAATARTTQRRKMARRQEAFGKVTSAEFGLRSFN